MTAGTAGPATAAAPPRSQERVFPARADQVREARRFLADLLAGCPAADDAVLCLSELASNSVRHSASRRPGGTFTVRAQVRPGDHVRIEVRDAGGPWPAPEPRPAPDERRPHGLGIVGTLAAERGRHGDAVTGWTVWAHLGWPAGWPASSAIFRCAGRVSACSSSGTWRPAGASIT